MSRYYSRAQLNYLMFEQQRAEAAKKKREAFAQLPLEEQQRLRKEAREKFDAETKRFEDANNALDIIVVEEEEKVGRQNILLWERKHRDNMAKQIFASHFSALERCEARIWRTVPGWLETVELPDNNANENLLLDSGVEQKYGDNNNDNTVTRRRSRSGSREEQQPKPFNSGNREEVGNIEFE